MLFDFMSMAAVKGLRKIHISKCENSIVNQKFSVYIWNFFKFLKLLEILKSFLL